MAAIRREREREFTEWSYTTHNVKRVLKFKVVPNKEERQPGNVVDIIIDSARRNILV